MILCYASDEKMYKYLHSTISRAFDYAPSVEKVCVGVKTKVTKEELRLDDDRIELVDMSFVDDELKFYFERETSEEHKKLDIQNKHNHKQWGTMSFARFYFPQVIPDVDKALYLDIDTWINFYLSELEKIDMEKYAVAGVREEQLSSNYTKKYHYRFNYLNSGVLYMNFNFFRKSNFLTVIKNALSNPDNYFPLPDQDLLSMALQEYILPIDSKFNDFHSTADCEKVVITHCNPTKQWNPESPLFEDYKKYDQMPFR